MAPVTDTGGGGGLQDLLSQIRNSTSGTNTMGQISAGGMNPDDPIVYLGTRESRYSDPQEMKVSQQLGYTYSPEVIKRRQGLSVTQMLTAFDAFSRKEFLYVRNRLAAAGYVSPDAMPVDVRTAYSYALTDAANFQASRPNVTFDGYLNNLIRMNGHNPNSIGNLGASGKPKHWKTTTKSNTIYELDDGEARSIMTNALQQYLGRDPSKGEVADFMNAVQHSAENDPTSRTTTTRYATRADGTTKRVASTTKTDSGYTADDAMWDAIDEAKQSPDYASYQAVSEYFPVLEQLLGASTGTSSL